MKNKIIRIVSSVFLCFALFLASCNSDKNSLTTVEGTWTLSQVVYNGTSYTPSEFASTEIGSMLSTYMSDFFCADGISILLEASGNGLLQNSCTSSSTIFTYTYSDKVVTMTKNNNTYTGNVSDDLATMQVELSYALISVTCVFAKN